MRISNIQTFAGGADDIIAVQLVQGSARHWSITIQDSDNNTVDLTGNTFEFDTIPATGDITPGRNNAFTLNNLAIDSGATATSRDNLVTNTNPTSGVVDLYLPADLYTGTVPFDSNTTTPIVVGTLRWTSGTTNPTIRSIRVLVVIRYGVVAT